MPDILRHKEELKFFQSIYFEGDPLDPHAGSAYSDSDERNGFKKSFVATNGRQEAHDRETENVRPEPGRWYHPGTDWACWMLADIGFTIVDEDVGVNLRDPVIKFSKR